MRLGLIALLLLWSTVLLAQPEFPPLTGRVVDRADMLDAATEAHLAEQLAAHERATSNQVVVVTLPELQGYDIADYGYQLGRHWGIGQQGEDNGALLIVARDERQVRIEVGYGLEGRLTDAQAAVIINRAIVPAFKQGDFERGISNGVQAVLQVLGGGALMVPAEPAEARERPDIGSAIFFFVMLFFITRLLARGGRRRHRRGSGLLTGALLGSALGRSHGGGFGGGGFGGGFGGGGGGFGGGGASGGW